jgi:hypothetical protein
LRELRHWLTLSGATFVETPVFTSRVDRYLDEKAYCGMQLSLLLRPTQGRVMPGTQGLGKMRWQPAHGGKRGGIRLIYLWVSAEAACYMLFIYSKTEQGDLTASQMKQLVRLVRDEVR